MKPAKSRRFAAMLLAVVLLAACAAEAPVPEAVERTRDVVFGYTSGNLNNPFSQEFLKYLQDECDAQGVTLMALDGENDVARQTAIIQQWTQDGLDAILCSPVNPTALQSSVDVCLSAGIPLINLDSEFERKTAYIGVDQYDYGYKAGKIAAEWMNENLPDAKPVKCAVLTKPQSLAVIERANGIVSALEQFCPRADIVGTPTYSDLESARVATRDLLAQHPDIHCIVGVADVAILGAYQAIGELGIDEAGICLVGLDATQELLNLMASGGAIRGSVSQNTELFARTAVAIAIAAVGGEEVASHTYMETLPVTTENWPSFVAPGAE